MFALANTISAAVARLTEKARAFCASLTAEPQRADSAELKPEPFYGRFDLSRRGDDDSSFPR